MPYKGYQLQVLFLQCVEGNGREVFAWQPVFIYVSHIAPLVFRQKEMKGGKKPPASLRKVTKSCLLPNNWLFFPDSSLPDMKYLFFKLKSQAAKGAFDSKLAPVLNFLN